jgi:5-methylcytosine-specific restriction endonuclease McrA
MSRRVLQACLACGQPTSNGTRCASCTQPSPYASAEYQINRRTVLAQEHECWLCGKPATPDDPLTADHVIPIDEGGTNARTNLRAAHSSCNSRRGAERQGVGGQPRPGSPREISRPRHRSRNLYGFEKSVRGGV